LLELTTQSTKSVYAVMAACWAGIATYNSSSSSTIPTT